jgi:hypothetical protein
MEKRYPDAIFRTYPSFGLEIVFAPTPLLPGKEARGDPGWTVDRIDIYNPPSSSASPSPATAGRRRVKTTGPLRKAPPFPISLKLAQRPVLPPPPVPPSETDGTRKTPPVPPTDSETAKHEFETDLLLQIESNTTGADLVQTLGEPSRKGGGDQWVAPWLEWTDMEIIASGTADANISHQHEGRGEKTVRLGIMVELRSTTSGGNGEKVHMPFGGVWEAAKGWEWDCIKVFAAA